MRQLLSTALVACIVGALAGASFGAVAQAPAEPPVSTTALNADTVDRLSAVKATSKKQVRANKLVATDAKGFLPSNIVKAKWGLIAGKPAFLADGVVGWNEVAGIPAGFADGVDNEGVTSVKITKVTGTPWSVAPGAGGEAYAYCPPDSKLTGGGFNLWSPGLQVMSSVPGWEQYWYVFAYNPTDDYIDIYAYAMCMKVEPAGALTVAKKGVVPASLKKAMKSRHR